MSRKVLLIAVLAITGGFFIMEIVAPGHWTFFTEYVSKTVDSATQTISGWMS